MLFHTAKKSGKRYQATVCGRLTHAVITNQFLHELTFFCNGPRREHDEHAVRHVFRQARRLRKLSKARSRKRSEAKHAV